jgi:enoyl-CoA hydratase/carnithine racemase
MLEECAQGALLVDRVDGLLTITIQRPEAKNALTPAILAALPGVLESHADCRFVVIRGSDCGAFSSGYDLNELRAARERDAAGTVLESALLALESFPRITVAAIDGWCVGAGLELALCCDLRFATPRSRFWLPAATLGVTYPEHGLRRLRSCVGRPAALRIVLLAEKWSAADAHRIGIVHEVTDDLDRLIRDSYADADNTDLDAIANMKHALSTPAESPPESGQPSVPDRASHPAPTPTMNQ